MDVSGRESQVAQILLRVQQLEIVARRNAASLLAGDYLTSFPGSGLVFHETHKYVPGEPARAIDWNITARLAEPYVKVHLEERQRDVFIAVDVSPSMHLGSQAKTKLELAVELAATLALTAIDGGDRVGEILFADEVLDWSLPAAGGEQLFRVLRSLLAHTSPWQRRVKVSDPRKAIEIIERHGGRRFVVLLISDFVDHDLPEDLKYLRPRHDVSLLHIYDPVEYAPPSTALRLPAVAAEGRTETEAFSPGCSGTLEEMQGYLRQESARYGIASASFSTAEPVPVALARFLHFKRAMVSR